MSLIYYQDVGLVDPEKLVSGEEILPPTAIAAALASKIRFAGQADEHSVTVLTHSIAVAALAARLASDYVSERPDDEFASPQASKFVEICRLWGLLHDATEAVLADVPKPVKETRLFWGYRAVEQELQVAYQKHYIPGLWGEGQESLRANVESIVHTADACRLVLEAIHLLPAAAVNNVIDSVNTGPVKSALLDVLIDQVKWSGSAVSSLQNCGDEIEFFVSEVGRLQCIIERKVK